ncbi:hypothetical protein [Halobacillus sp. K22]|uniref:hypothetical protein n=1 Tax=Halobacillus sp. K22 TaxID=3457431 RepID=UPI003FCC5801
MAKRQTNLKILLPTIGIYLTAETYNDETSSKALPKLRQDSIRYNEFREKVKKFFDQTECEDVERILTWDEDLSEGMSIRRSHGYIK